MAQTRHAAEARKVCTEMRTPPPLGKLHSVNLRFALCYGCDCLNLPLQCANSFRKIMQSFESGQHLSLCASAQTQMTALRDCYCDRTCSRLSTNCMLIHRAVQTFVEAAMS